MHRTHQAQPKTTREQHGCVNTISRVTRVTPQNSQRTRRSADQIAEPTAPCGAGSAHIKTQPKHTISTRKPIHVNNTSVHIKQGRSETQDRTESQNADPNRSTRTPHALTQQSKHQINMDVFIPCQLHKGPQQEPHRTQEDQQPDL